MSDIDKALAMVQSMLRQVRQRRIAVLRARLALRELVQAAKYTGKKENQREDI